MKNDLCLTQRLEQELMIIHADLGQSFLSFMIGFH